MSRFIRCTLAAFVLVCLTAGAARAVPVRPDVALSEAGRLLDAGWDWLVNRLRPAEPPARPDRSAPRSQQKYGCGMDPDGKPKPCAY
ncbi:MAG TPA: hypothetical protein VHC97_10395 [Thermoanaerobaculia bacterium]|jgi:hypothetical protein|nr:hypothetical protein [Thermoanaerobaculia bacterium]